MAILTEIDGFRTYSKVQGTGPYSSQIILSGPFSIRMAHMAHMGYPFVHHDYCMIFEKFSLIFGQAP